MTASSGLRLIVGIASTGRPDVLHDTLCEIAGQTRLPDLVALCVACEEDLDRDGLVNFPFSTVVLTGGMGLTRQRNVILGISGKFDVIVFFDDDFFPSVTYLENTAELFDRQPDVVVATGTLIADGIHGPGLTPYCACQCLSAFPAPHEGRVYQYYGAYGCNMAIRLRPVHAHGIRFDEALPLYGWQEDIDFSRQLAPYGEIVKSDALAGVHLGVKSGRSPGVRFGYSQLANPIYLVRKGTMSCRFAALTMTRNLIANVVRFPRPEPYVDRRGRLRGNLLALGDLMRGRLDPMRIMELA
jgi:GT2 family glycosyltransferase